MVLPLYDDDPLELPVPPYVTWGLIAANIVVFIFEVASGAGIVAKFGATPAVLLHHAPPAGPLPPEATLVTSMFMHNSWAHLFGNMIYLWVFGDDIEEALGRIRFIVFYLLCGVAAALAYIAFNPSSTIPLVGASGAISGVLAAYLMLRPCAKVSVFFFRAVIRVRAYWLIGGWALVQVYLLAGKANDGVAYLAHVGGLVAGAALFAAMRPSGVKLFQCVEQPGEEAEDC